jgi:hypothetical protein
LIMTIQAAFFKARDARYCLCERRRGGECKLSAR